MIDTIKDVVQNILNHWGLTDYATGIVAGLDPLCIKIDDRLYLQGENVVRTTALGELAAGDKLVMLRVLRGQKYILLSKVVV